MYNEVYGGSSCKICGKGRVILPTYTGCQEGERLAVQLLEYDDVKAIKIYEYEKFIVLINKYKELLTRKILNHDSNKIEEIDKLKEEYHRYIESIAKNIKVVTVDSQRRIHLTKETLATLGWNKGDECVIFGCGDYLKIEQKQQEKCKKM